MRICLFFLFISFLFSIACSTQHLQHDGGALTRSEVEWLSKNLSENIEKRYSPLKHKLVNRYVDGLGQYIVSHNSQMPPLPYEFRVLKSNEVHIFSLPGGIVYITLGTLRAFDLEGQLAAAIAHELAHQQLGHSLTLWRKRVNASRGQKFIIPFDQKWELLFLGENGFLAYDEEMEKEADQAATLLLYKANYDPRVMVSYLEVIKKMELSKSTSVSAMLSLHPKSDERIAWVKEQLNKIPPLKDARLTASGFAAIKALLKTAEIKSKKKESKKEK